MGASQSRKIKKLNKIIKLCSFLIFLFTLRILFVNMYSNDNERFAAALIDYH